MHPVPFGAIVRVSGILKFSVYFLRPIFLICSTYLTRIIQLLLQLLINEDEYDHVFGTHYFDASEGCEHTFYSNKQPISIKLLSVVIA